MFSFITAVEKVVTVIFAFGTIKDVKMAATAKAAV